MLERVYAELHRLAHGRLARLRPGQTLNTTALVDESYLKLVQGGGTGWEDRGPLPRRELSGHAADPGRAGAPRECLKRGGAAVRVSADEHDVPAPERAAEDLATSPRTLKRDWRKARVLLYGELHAGWEAE